MKRNHSSRRKQTQPAPGISKRRAPVDRRLCAGSRRGMTDPVPSAGFSSLCRFHIHCDGFSYAETSLQHLPRDVPANRSNGFDGDRRTWESQGDSCAWGVPIAVGTAVENVAGSMDVAVMSSIQADNFKFVRHMIISGWSYSSANQSQFSVTINRLGADRQVKEDWHVSNASPLHYAISCGALSAAAALLVAFPELSATTCRVQIESENNPPTSASWTPLELASFFARLYAHVDPARHSAYQQASVVLRTHLVRPAAFPGIQLNSPRERLLAAGSDLSVILAALDSEQLPSGL